MIQTRFTEEALETLLEDASRVRRLAIAIRGDPAPPRIERFAEELKAEITRLARLD
jgi:hypothetical protein